MNSNSRKVIRLRHGSMWIAGIFSLMVLLNTHKAAAQLPSSNSVWVSDCTNIPCALLTNSSVSYIYPEYADSISPSMPAISMWYPSATCTDVVDYALNVSYIGIQNQYFPNATTTYGAWAAEMDPGSDEWDIDWDADLLTNYDLEGGQATVYMSVDNGPYQNELTFQIQGVNESYSAQQSLLKAYGAPWYYNGILGAESGATSASGLINGTVHQFYTPGVYAYTLMPCSLSNNPNRNGVYVYQLGYPVFGCPDGYGEAQVDGTKELLTDYVLWDWSANLQSGIAIANSKIPVATATWRKIANSYQADPYRPAPPPTLSLGNCIFSFSSSSPGSFGDAASISYYNGAGQIYTYDSKQHKWTQNQGATGYVAGVCKFVQSGIQSSAGAQ